MSVHRIASRYAKSLIDLSVEQNKLDRILEDIQYFNEVCKVKDFMFMLRNPVVNQDKKIAALKSLFIQKFDGLTYAFIELIVKKGREANLSEIAKEFVVQYRLIKKISLIKLTTAEQISPSAVQLIKEKLQAQLENGVVIELETSVNPDLIGGFIIETADKVYDASISDKLEEMKKLLFTDNPFVSKILA
jgi:F-type H+-transporting ATPase subunit delta